MERVVVIHSAKIVQQLARLPPTAMFGFGIACCQRLWPWIYDEGLALHPVDALGRVKLWLEDLWDWLIYSKNRPVLSHYLAELVVSTSGPTSEYEDCLQGLNIYYGFARTIEGNAYAEVYLVSDMVLALLDNYLYRSLSLEVNSTNDSIIDAHPLILSEIARQLYDVEQYASCDYKALRLARSRSEAQDVRIIGSSLF